MGTLATLLAGKKIKTYSGLFDADVTGDIHDVDGTLKITSINVDYTLKVPEDKKSDALDAFEKYLPFCPGAQSVIGCIEITHKITLEEIE
jgi:organic hydroperoxide reductase OsmC/OhrA